MAIGTLFGGGSESSGLYGIATGSAVNPVVVSQTYFEWFIFTTSAGTPATPTGGSWNFTSNIGTAPAGWSNFISGVPLDSLWFSVAFVDSRNPLAITWSTPGLISSQSVYATAYANVFTGNGSTVAWTLSNDPVVVNNTDVSINGVTQVPTTDYTISGTTLTTTTAAPLNAIILVKYRQALPLSYYGAASNVQFTPVGALTATNVQAAITEVVTDLALSSGSSTVGFLQAGTSAVPTTVQAKLRQTVSVADFGAVGDGATNASTAINAALSACAEYGLVVFPSGTYLIDATVTIPKNNITLDGQGSRFLAKASTNFEYVLFADSKSNISVRNLTIDANQVNRITGQNIRFMGAGFTSCVDSYFENCIAKNALGYASIPAVGLTFGGVCIRCEFINCIAQNCGTVTQGADGFFASGEANMIIGCNAVNCTDTGFAIESSNASGIVGCIARSCAAAAAITNAVNDDKFGNFITDLSGFDTTGGGGVTGLIQIGCPLSTSTGVLYDTLISNVNLVSVGVGSGVGPAINIRKTGTPKAVRVTLNNVNIKNATTQGILVDANQVSIRGCDITGTTNACINFLTGSTSNFVSGCTFFGGPYGVLTSGTATATVENNLMNSQTSYGIYADGTSTINAMFNIIQTPTIGNASKAGGATLNLVSGLSGLQLNNASGSAPAGALSNKIQVFDKDNNSLGFLAVYAS